MSEQDGGRSKKRRRRSSKKRRSSRRDSAPPSLRERAIRVHRELRGLIRALGEKHGATRADLESLRLMEARVRVSLARRPNNPATEPSLLVDELEAELLRMMRASIAFRRGHVFHLMEDRPDGSGTLPPKPQSVFIGYTSAGRPRWQLFTNLCLERGEDRVDRLYGGRPEIIALVQTDAELNDALFEGTDPDALPIRVRGQVAVGLVPETLDVRDCKAPRLAFGVQIVELASGDPKQRLRLNLIGLSDELILRAALSSGERGPAEALRRTLRAHTRELTGLAKRLEQPSLAAEEAEGLLTRAIASQLSSLRGDIERVFRPVHRRTQHAQERHQGGERPTGHALTDARSANPEQLLEDTLRHTIIVLGSRGRAHVFAKNGRHVTSFRLRSGELERKQSQGRWKTLDAERSRAFQNTVSEAESA